MSFIELNEDLDNVAEAPLAEDGTYTLVIESAEEKVKEETGRTNIAVRIAFEDHPDNQSIFHNVSLPIPDDKDTTRKMLTINLKRFLTLFNIPYEGRGFNVEDFLGARAENVMVKKEPREDKPEEEQNRIVIPKLKV